MMADTTRLLAGRHDPKALAVFLRIDAGTFTLHTADTFLLTGQLDSLTGPDLPSLYRWLRGRFGKMPITMHLASVDRISQLVDALPNECRFGRLAVVHQPDLPPVPPNPDQDDIDLVVFIENDGEAMQA